MPVISYPTRLRSLDDLANQDLLDLTTSQVLSWQQGAGNFGALHLHACWGESSVLTRRYHGQTASKCYNLSNNFGRLYDFTKDPKWLWHTEDVITNLVSLQSANGGFIHSSNEFEPTYTDTQTCPIAQGLCALTLTNYLLWPSASSRLIPRIRNALAKHWQWFIHNWWLKGNKWTGPLDTAGFCGVTNQDLVVVAALAAYSEATGDNSYYRDYGELTLERYLSPRFYHRSIGLFERGDSENFAERTGYMILILEMLKRIHKSNGDIRLPAVIENVASHLFDTLYEADDGKVYAAWGAETSADDKEKVVNWLPRPIIPGEMLSLSRILRQHMGRTPSPHKSMLLDRLEENASSYIFSDGTIPFTLGGADELFAIAGNPVPLWREVIGRLGESIKSPTRVPLPCVHRTFGSATWKHNESMWSIETHGVRQFSGLKANPSAIAVGPNERIPGADYERLDQSDAIESIDFR